MYSVAFAYADADVHANFFADDAQLHVHMLVIVLGLMMLTLILVLAIFLITYRHQCMHRREPDSGTNAGAHSSLCCNGAGASSPSSAVSARGTRLVR